MDRTQPLPRRIAIGLHPSIPDAASEAEQITQFLLDNGVEQVVSAALPDAGFQNELLAGGFDLLIALGGDGTIEGRYRIEDRMMLKVAHLRGQENLGEWSVLNEVVVCRGQVVRPVRLKACADGYFLANYVADGLIVATPTGSTAYSLAVGGPILPPELRNILIVAVAPHLSVDRTVVLAEGTVIEVTVNTTHQAVMSVDGQAPVPMLDGDHIRAEALPDSVHFIRFEDRGYFYRNLTTYMEQNPATRENS